MIKMKETKCKTCGGFNLKLVGKGSMLCHDDCIDCRKKKEVLSGARS